jgi:hypothetical protein
VNHNSTSIRYLLAILTASVLSLTVSGCGLNGAEPTALSSDDLRDPNDLPTRFTELETIRKAYSESEILVLATANHSTWKRYRLRADLLAAEKDDGALSTVVLERSEDISALYEQLSTSSLNEQGIIDFVSSQGGVGETICRREWAYSLKHFMPEVQRINAKRSHLDKIKVTAVDSVSSKLDMGWPLNLHLSGNQLQNTSFGDCSFDVNPDVQIPGLNFFTMFTTSLNREIVTAANFESKIWRTRIPGEKIVVMHHLAHLLQETQNCMAVWDGVKNWTTQTAAFSWFDIFLRNNPTARDSFKIVFLDEKDDAMNPSGALMVSAELAAKVPERSFGVFTADIAQRAERDLGLGAFQPDSFFPKYSNQKLDMSKSILKQVDAVVWNGDADSYKLSDFSVEKAFPNACPGGDVTESSLESRN